MTHFSSMGAAILAWITTSASQIAVALIAAVLLTSLLWTFRSIAIRACRYDRLGTGWPALVGTTIGRTRIWFVAALSLGLIGVVLSLVVSCVGRRLVLGERCEEELEVALDGLPQGTDQVGFYSYGEISPLASGYCDLHNQTLTLTTISEQAA